MKYWAYVKNEILGPFEKEKLLELPEFSASLLICPQTPVGEKTEDWKEASAYPEIAALTGAQGAAPGAGAQAGQSAGNPAPAENPSFPQARAASPEPAGEAMQLEPRAAGGLKHLNPTELNPSLLGHKEPGSAFDIPVVKLSGELGGHGKIGHPGTIQSEELHKSDAPAASAASAPEAAVRNEPLPLQETAAPQEALPAQEAAAPEPAGAAPLSLPPAQAAAPEARNFSASFDPISLSSIGGNKQPGSPAPAAPETASPAPAADYPARQAAPPAAESQAAPAAPPFDPAIIEEMIKRNLKLAVSPPPDIRSHLDPLVIKIDQMGEILSSMRNSQFQQEVLTKIRLIEDSISELRGMVGGKPVPAAEKPAEKGKTSGFFGFAPSPAKKEPPPAEKAPAPAPAKEEEPVDEGSKASSKAGGAIKKLLRGMVTLALLAAVLGGAAFMLRNLGIFDVTPYIPFPIPGLTAGGAQPAAEETPEQPAAGGPAAGQETPAAPAGPGGQAASAGGQDQDVSPEIIFIARTHSAKEGGEILESKIIADAIAKKGEITKMEWQVSRAEGDNYKAQAVIPVSGGKPLVYAFGVERANKRVTPDNYEGREVMQALFGEKPAAPKPAAKKPARKSARPPRTAPAKTAPKAAPKPAPKAEPKQAADEAEPAADDEYEYVYVEEEEAGGGDEAEYLMSPQAGGMPGFDGR